MDKFLHSQAMLITGKNFYFTKLFPYCGWFEFRELTQLRPCLNEANLQTCAEAIRKAKELC
jgi:hypothetical protein